MLLWFCASGGGVKTQQSAQGLQTEMTAVVQLHSRLPIVCANVPALRLCADFLRRAVRSKAVRGEKSKQLLNYTVPRGFAHRKRNPQRSHKPPCESQSGPPFHYVPGSDRSKHVIPFIIYELGERKALSFAGKGQTEGRRTRAVLPLRVSLGKAARCSASPDARSQRRAWRSRF